LVEGGGGLKRVLPFNIIEPTRGTDIARSASSETAWPCPNKNPHSDPDISRMSPRKALHIHCGALPSDFL